MRPWSLLALALATSGACGGDDGGGGTEDPGVDLATPAEIATDVPGLSVTVEAVTEQPPAGQVEPVVFEVTIALAADSAEPAAAISLRLQGDEPYSGRLVAGDDTVEAGEEARATIQVDVPAGAAVDSLLVLDSADLIAEVDV